MVSTTQRITPFVVVCGALLLAVTAGAAAPATRPADSADCPAGRYAGRQIIHVGPGSNSGPRDSAGRRFEVASCGTTCVCPSRVNSSNWTPPPGDIDTYRITVNGSDGGTARAAKNVMFGDVFFCSGQSNMDFPVKAAYNSTMEMLSLQVRPRPC